MAIWTPTQKTTSKKLKEEGCKRIYQVEVPAPKVQEAIHNVFLRLQLKARISGFRQGKAPLDIIKQQYANHAREQAAEDIISASVPEVLKDLSLSPVVLPTVGAIRYEESKPLSFELHVEIAPEFEPKGYKGLTATRKTHAVSDADVQARLLQLQEGNARLEKSSAQVVGKEHYVIIGYEMLRDGVPVPGASGKEELVDMSSEQTIKGLLEGLEGAERHQPREFSVELNGQAALCKATVVEIKEKILPKLDDEFAKDLGLETLDALKAKLRELIAAEVSEKAEREVAQQIEKGLLSSNKIPVPPTLAEHQLEHTLERLQRRFANGKRTLPETEIEKLRGELRPAAEDQVRLQFIFSGIAKKENITVTEEDVSKEHERSLAGAQSEEQKKDIEHFFENSKDEIRAALRERKVMAFVREAATIKEEVA